MNFVTSWVEERQLLHAMMQATQLEFIQSVTKHDE
jgi:hypothetical protein